LTSSSIVLVITKGSGSSRNPSLPKPGNPMRVVSTPYFTSTNFAIPKIPYRFPPVNENHHTTNFPPLPIPTGHHGFSWATPFRPLKTLRQREARAPTKPFKRDAKGQNSRMYVLLPSLVPCSSPPSLHHRDISFHANTHHPAVHNLTDTCWKKCVTGKISSGKLERGEESCTQNCVERFLDANDAVLRHLGAMRGQGEV